jgi:hypothetical protein
MIVTDLSSDVITMDVPTERHQSNIAGQVLAASFTARGQSAPPKTSSIIHGGQRHV